jgi:hypothetical protein
MSAFTIEQYQTLCGMLAKGVTSLSLGNGEQVTYRSLEEMLKLKRVMETDLGLPGGGAGRQIYPTYRKG